jgi:hypothetical protein
MVARLAAIGVLVLAAAAALPALAPGAPDDIRIDVLSASPDPPRAAKPFELVARVEFAPSTGSIHCRVWAGGQRFRNIRLVWKSSIARCFFRVPAAARGKRLTVGLVAALGGSRTRTTLSFRVS